jgi:hypothetical protein
MAAQLMDARRNAADGREVPAEVQAHAASYYGTYSVDPARQVVKHHVAMSFRPAESGTLERAYEFRDASLILRADALMEGVPVTHTLVWARAVMP